MSNAFEEPELLREALREVAEADVGDWIEEPWGSAALAAAEQVAREGAPHDVVQLARAAVERVAANAELLDLIEDEEAWEARLDELRRRLA